MPAKEFPTVVVEVRDVELGDEVREGGAIEDGHAAHESVIAGRVAPGRGGLRHAVGGRGPDAVFREEFVFDEVELCDVGGVDDGLGAGGDGALAVVVGRDVGRGRRGGRDRREEGRAHGRRAEAAAGAGRADADVVAELRDGALADEGRDVERHEVRLVREGKEADFSARVVPGREVEGLDRDDAPREGRLEEGAHLVVLDDEDHALVVDGRGGLVVHVGLRVAADARRGHGVRREARVRGPVAIDEGDGIVA